MLLLQQLINGIMLGGVYALFATGLSLTLGVGRVLNMVHGVTLTIVAIAGVEFANSTHANFVTLTLFGAVVGACMGLASELLAYRPIRKSRKHDEHSAEWAMLVSSMALFLILTGGMRLYLTKVSTLDVLAFPRDTFKANPLRIGQISVPAVSVVMLVAAVVLVGATWLVVQRTQTGRSVRAMATDPEAAQMMGINVDLVSAGLLALSGAMAGIAGILIGVGFTAVDASTGDQYLLIGFAVVVLGGVGSVPGALLGSMLIGVVQGLTVYFVGSRWISMTAFICLFITLIIRPNGLLGRTEARRA